MKQNSGRLTHGSLKNKKTKLAAKQNMTQPITEEATDATKVVMMTVREVDAPDNNARPIHKAPR